MKKLYKGINHLFEGVTFMMVVSMIGIVLIQVLARFLLPKAPSWTEELSRILFVSSVAFSAPIAMRKQEFVRVDTLTSLLPKKVACILEIIVDTMVFVFIWLVAYYAMDFVQLGTMQKSPSLGLSMSIPFSSMMIASIFIGAYGLIRVIELIRNFKKSKI